MRRKLVQFGAGNIGRSFIGQVFAHAGYEVVFVDVDATIVDQLNRRRCYTVVVKEDGAPDTPIVITNVRAVHGADGDAVLKEIDDASVVSTAVGARALPKLAPLLAAAAKRRRNKPFDVIIAENVRGASGILRTAIREATDDDSTPIPGLVETSIGKMVPIMTEEDRKEDPLRVFAEPYNTLIVDKKGFRGELPKVPHIKFVEYIEPYVDRKLFIHNLGHAACSYLGYQVDPTVRYVWQAVRMPAVRESTAAAMNEAACGLMRRYPDEFTSADLEAHIADLLHRFGNSALGDTIFRVGRDLRRKLGRNDRLIGAMCLAASYDCPFDSIARATAAAFEFRATDENGAPFADDADLLSEIEDDAPGQYLSRVCGLDIGDPIEANVLRRVSGFLVL